MNFNNRRSEQTKSIIVKCLASIFITCCSGFVGSTAVAAPVILPMTITQQGPNEGTCYAHAIESILRHYGRSFPYGDIVQYANDGDISKGCILYVDQSGTSYKDCKNVLTYFGNIQSNYVSSLNFSDIKTSIDNEAPILCNYTYQGTLNAHIVVICGYDEIGEKIYFLSSLEYGTTDVSKPAGLVTAGSPDMPHAMSFTSFNSNLVWSLSGSLILTPPQIESNTIYFADNYNANSVIEQQEQGNWCWAAVCQSTLKANNVYKTQSEIAHYAFNASATATDNSLNKENAIVSVGNTKGLIDICKNLSNVKLLPNLYSNKLRFDDVKFSIGLGYPVIALHSMTYAGSEGEINYNHYNQIIGFRNYNQQVYVLDPARTTVLNPFPRKGLMPLIKFNDEIDIENLFVPGSKTYHIEQVAVGFHNNLEWYQRSGRTNGQLPFQMCITAGSVDQPGSYKYTAEHYASASSDFVAPIYFISGNDKSITNKSATLTRYLDIKGLERLPADGGPGEGHYRMSVLVELSTALYESSSNAEAAENFVSGGALDQIEICYENIAQLSLTGVADNYWDISPSSIKLATRITSPSTEATGNATGLYRMTFDFIASPSMLIRSRLRLDFKPNIFKSIDNKRFCNAVSIHGVSVDFVDSDNDNVPWVNDNCPCHDNPVLTSWTDMHGNVHTNSQMDSDGDGTGDICDPTAYSWGIPGMTLRPGVDELASNLNTGTIYTTDGFNYRYETAAPGYEYYLSWGDELQDLADKSYNVNNEVNIDPVGYGIDRDMLSRFTKLTNPYIDQTMTHPYSHNGNFRVQILAIAKLGEYWLEDPQRWYTHDPTVVPINCPSVKSGQVIPSNIAPISVHIGTTFAHYTPINYANWVTSRSLYFSDDATTSETNSTAEYPLLYETGATTFLTNHTYNQSGKFEVVTTIRGASPELDISYSQDVYVYTDPPAFYLQGPQQVTTSQPENISVTFSRIGVGRHSVCADQTTIDVYNYPANTLLYSQTIPGPWENVSLMFPGRGTYLVKSKGISTPISPTEPNNYPQAANEFIENLIVVKETAPVPTIGCVAPTAPLINRPFQFNYTNIGGSVTSVSWDFGDGAATSTASQPSHSYAKPGTYTVTLTTNGPDYSATCQYSVTVKADISPILNLLLN